MNRQHAEAYAASKLEEHGLREQGWSFVINDRATTRVLGTCCYHSKRIVLTGWYVDANGPEAVHDTILHEIAHALAGSEAAHGPDWQAVASRIGADPYRLVDHRTVNQLSGRFAAVCTQCGQKYWRSAKPIRRQWHCPCTKTMNPRPVLTYERTHPVMMAASHQRIGDDVVALTAPATAPTMPLDPQVDSLLTSLVSASPDEAKKIRARLRRLGHKGGLR